MGGPGSGRKKGSKNAVGYRSSIFTKMQGAETYSTLSKMKGLKKTKSGDFYEPKDHTLWKKAGMGMHIPYRRRRTTSEVNFYRKYPTAKNY